ncbi:acyltransferase [Scandinavium sp.]|uniref:acyltransferase family protein n=1 Tax=Scandinavium sp. TaxID=2830653 RepID=UPI00289E10D6|nr:acyltransferase [Scandinavium sp.]
MQDTYIQLLFIITTMFLTAVLFSTKLFIFIDSNTKSKRNNGLDGLRFFLASFVIFHHMDFYRNFFDNGSWVSHNTLFIYMGRVGVAVFFMITAYLFWGKIREKNSVDWISLYKERFFRIAPLSFFVSILAVFIIFLSKGTPLITKSELANFASWFDAGIFDRKQPINNFGASRIVIAGVTWTLRWEWMFYFTLPALFMLRKVKYEASITLFIGSLFLLGSYTNVSYIWSFFFSGVLAKELEDKIEITQRTLNLSFLAIAALFYLVEPAPNSDAFTVFIFIMFFMVIKGFSFFGVLNTTGVMRLGHISYSLYLTQGLVLYVVYYSLHNKMHGVNLYIVLLSAFMMIACLSSITYKLIERPFITFGKR